VLLLAVFGVYGVSTKPPIHGSLCSGIQVPTKTNTNPRIGLAVDLPASPDRLDEALLYDL
jgi:hypothetical protein